MNTITKIALGTAASGVVILAGVAPAIAAPASMVTPDAVATPPTVSSTAQTPAHSTSVGVPAPVASSNHTAATTHSIGMKEWFPEATRTAPTATRTIGLELPIAPVGATHQTGPTTISHVFGPCPNPDHA